MLKLERSMTDAARMTDLDEFHPRTGVVIDGRWRLEERLGEGGFGVAWRAIDERLKRPVVVKLLHPQRAEHDPREYRARINNLLAEARILAQLAHPGVVGVHDLHDAPPAGERGWPAYIVLDFVNGSSLQHLLQESGRLLDGEVVEVAEALLPTLDAVHRAGIFHRDLSPANVLLRETAPGGFVLIDFGLARLDEANDELQLIAQRIATLPHERRGTPPILAPEYIQDRIWTPRSDVWAAGTLLWWLLAGQPPYTGSWQEIFDAVLHEPLPDFHDAAPHAAAWWNEPLRQALAKDPNARPANTLELLDLIRLSRSSDQGEGVASLAQRAEIFLRDLELAAPQDSDRDQQRSSSSVELEPFEAWDSGGVVADPREASRSEIADSLRAIVETEAPVSVARLVRLYGAACDAGRLGAQLRAKVDLAIKLMIERDGLVTRAETRPATDESRIVSTLEHGFHRARTAGGRDIAEISLRELAAAATIVTGTPQPDASERSLRRVAETLGYPKLVPRVRARLAAAIRLAVRDAKRAEAREQAEPPRAATGTVVEHALEIATYDHQPGGYRVVDPIQLCHELAEALDCGSGWDDAIRVMNGAGFVVLPDPAMGQPWPDPQLGCAVIYAGDAPTADAVEVGRTHLELMYAMALADGRISDDERSAIQDIASRLGAGDDVAARWLIALAYYLPDDLPSFDGLVDQLRALAAEDSARLMRELSAIAWADGRMDQAEEQMLRRCHAALGMPVGEVYADAAADAPDRHGALERLERRLRGDAAA
jgi:serine/threonine protein kinase/uncharacterized tellurite resistance protein B-like protein